MGSVQLNRNGDCIDDTSVEKLLTPDASDIYNVFGDQELFPRVGDQYQVEIPEVIAKSDYLLYKKNPFEVAFAPSVPSDFLMGLPIPIMWINKEIEDTKHEGLQSLHHSNGKSSNRGVFKSETNKEAQICSGDADSKLKLEPDIAWENGIGSGESANLALEQEMNIKMCQKFRGEGCYLVPGSLGGPWSDIEEASFLLGLYIFGKNLRQVKKFIETKTMGDVQSYYYGKFYKSDKYRRWSDCRKMRSRKFVYGQRIFTGLRQQELLSRLFLHVSEECQKTLIEVSKTFGEGKMPLEEYVSTLKSIVGINSLVEAVGIGKGKRDLTGITLEPSKSNHIISMRPEIPIGKACSSLTPVEIIKFLTGDFRLSKARSNDLFWEAVWPRLLARGWHSEQPKDHNYAAGYKQTLVFLMPGVKKFSRRRLLKGNHYFDSVPDVLSKVASDPGLLELDSEADESGRKKEENGWTAETKLEQDNSFDRQRHCYLQPRTPNRVTDLMKFTVVDTSLADGKTFKVRELRTLPTDVSKMAVSRSHSEESDEDSSGASSKDSDYVDTVFLDQDNTNKSNSAKALSAIGVFSLEKNLEIGASYQGTKGPNSGAVSVKNSKDLNNFRENKQPRKKMKQDDLDYLAPVTKRHVDTILLNQEDTNKSNSAFGMLSFQKSLHVGASDQGTKVPDSGAAFVRSSNTNSFCENKQRRKKMKHNDLQYLAPVTKRRVDPMSFDLEATNSSNSAKAFSAVGMLSFQKGLEIGASNQGTNGRDSGAPSFISSNDLNNFGEKKLLIKSKKCSQEMKQDGLHYLAPVTKRFVDTMSFDSSNSMKALPAIGMLSFQKNLEMGVPNQGTKGPDSGAPSVRSSNFCENKQPRKSKKSSRGMSQNDLNYSAPVTKRRRRLSACNQAETSNRIPGFSVNPSLGQEKRICCSETTADSSENNLSGNGSSQKRVSPASSSKGSLIESSEGVSCDIKFGAEGPCEKPQPRPLIDLNLPQVSPDYGTCEISTGSGDGHETSKPEKSAEPPKPSEDVAFPEQQPLVNSRRQSTRNRPLTMRALEALANGYLTTNTRRKNKEAFPRENSRSRPPRRASGETEITENAGSGTVDSQTVEVGNGTCNDDSEVFSRLQVLSEGNATPITGPQVNVMGNFQL